MYCWTCDSDETHRNLTDAESTWLKNRLGRKFVNEFFMCEASGCRNLRTGLNKKPFDVPIRVPVD
ncbi:hypothetical protein [Streptomyces sp. B6B3]|uniref:hypothetical protein n=1 Tax=Streptomyces sp. B6B3 TaxID=3153570 RepID=UPI00325F3565